MLYNCSNKCVCLFCVSSNFSLIATTAPIPAFTRQMAERIVHFVCFSASFFACHYVVKSIVYSSHHSTADKRPTGEKWPVEKPSEGEWMI